MRLFSDTMRNGSPGCEVNELCAGAGRKYALEVSIQAKLHTIDFRKTLRSTTISVMQVPLKLIFKSDRANNDIQLVTGFQRLETHTYDKTEVKGQD